MRKISIWLLTTIKNFGESIAEAIVEERKVGGPFVSVADFLTRVTSKNLNKKSLEALIMTGCFDAFDDRGVLMQQYRNTPLLPQRSITWKRILTGITLWWPWRYYDSCTCT